MSEISREIKLHFVTNSTDAKISLYNNHSFCLPNTAESSGIADQGHCSSMPQGSASSKAEHVFPRHVHNTLTANQAD